MADDADDAQRGDETSGPGGTIKETKAATGPVDRQHMSESDYIQGGVPLSRLARFSFDLETQSAARFRQQLLGGQDAR